MFLGINIDIFIKKRQLCMLTVSTSNRLDNEMKLTIFKEIFSVQLLDYDNLVKHRIIINHTKTWHCD